MQTGGTHRTTRPLPDEARSSSAPEARTTGGSTYEGLSLATIMSAGALPASSVAWMGSQLARSLITLHEAIDTEGRALHLVHTRVVPQHVLVDDDGTARLRDATVARVGLLPVALRFQAPELLRGDLPSVCTDIYALGVTLWEAALGRPVLSGDESAMRVRLLRAPLVPDDDGGRIPARIVDALGALVSSLSQRIHNVRAVARIFDGLVFELPGGPPELRQRARAAIDGLMQSEGSDPRTAVAFGGFVAAARALSPEVVSLISLLPHEAPSASLPSPERDDAATETDHPAASLRPPSFAFPDEPTERREYDPRILEAGRSSSSIEPAAAAPAPMAAEHGAKRPEWLGELSREVHAAPVPRFSPEEVLRHRTPHAPPPAMARPAARPPVADVWFQDGSAIDHEAAHFEEETPRSVLVARRGSSAPVWAVTFVSAALVAALVFYWWSRGGML